MANLGILIVFGLSLFGGLLGASFFQKIKVPQVVGYIIIGIIIGSGGFNIITKDDVESLKQFSMFALGIIGFLVGGELKFEDFKKFGKQYFAILFGEGVLAFIIVGILSAVVVFLEFHSIIAAVSAGVVLGAIASATDPASTIDVLWEYRAYGPLTTTLTAIVALDDALAMTLYGIGTGTAELLTAKGAILKEVIIVLFHLSGSIVAGILMAFILKYLLSLINSFDKYIPFALGILMLLIGISDKLDFDVILASMAMGCTLSNIAPRRTKPLFETLKKYSLPIYVLFFVLVGARIEFHHLPIWLWVIVMLYVVGRSAGKAIGAYLGAKKTNSPDVVRKYLGLGLAAQGGVAIGLSMTATHRLGHVGFSGTMKLGDVIILTVAMTTFIVQLIGPPLVKLAIKLSDEAGKNITEDDVIDSLKNKDVMIKDIVVVKENEPVIDIAEKFSMTDQTIFPVVNEDGELTGVVTINDLREIFMNQEMWRWIIAADIMQPVMIKADENTPLRETFNLMNQYHFSQAIAGKNVNGKFIPTGLLEMTSIRKAVERERLIRSKPKQAA